MYSVFIVDDEPRARRGLAALIRAHNPCWEIAGLYGDGESALSDMAGRPRIDLVVSDIRMPQMDGLAFVSRLRALAPGAAVILVSGYGEFEYARTAISLQVKLFLLKPVKRDELFRALDMMRGELGRRDAGGPSLGPQALWHYRDLLFRALVLAGGEAPQDFEAKAGPVPNPCRLLVVKGRPPFVPLEGEALRGALANACGGPVFQADGLHLAALLDEEGHRERVEALAARFPRLQAGLSMPCRGAAELPAAYRQGRAALGRFLYCPGASGCLYPSAASPTPRYDPAGDAARLFGAVSAARAEDVAACLAAFWEQVGRLQPGVYLLEAWCAALYGALERAARQFPVEWAPALREGACASLEELRAVLADDAARLAGEIGTVQKKREGRYVEKIKQFVQQNYRQDISLDMVAAHVGLNGSYVSSLFRAAAGATLVDYITEVRLEQAKRLLLQTDLKSCEVARQAGYNDPNYFNRIFKKKLGLSPRAFRSLVR